MIQKKQKGFTLMELMLVVAVIGILAAVAIPAYHQYTIKAWRAERASLVQPVREAVAAYYDRWGKFPGSNAEAGLPVPEAFRGEMVNSVEVREGIILVNMTKNHTIRHTYPEKPSGKDSNTGQHGKKLEEICTSFFRPAVNVAYPTGALIWVRDANEIPDKFRLVPAAGNLKNLLASEKLEICPN